MTGVIKRAKIKYRFNTNFPALLISKPLFGYQFFWMNRGHIIQQYTSDPLITVYICASKAPCSTGIGPKLKSINETGIINYNTVLTKNVSVLLLRKL